MQYFPACSWVVSPGSSEAVEAGRSTVLRRANYQYVYELRQLWSASGPFCFWTDRAGYASLFFVINVGLTYTLGTLIASMSNMSLSKALLNLFKLPMIYAMLLALIFLYTAGRFHYQSNVPPSCWVMHPFPVC